MNNALYKRRLLINKFNLTMAWATMAFGLFWLAWILITLFGQGMDGLLDIKTYTMDTPPAGTEGGLRNAIIMMDTPYGRMLGRQSVSTGVWTVRWHSKCFLPLLS